MVTAPSLHADISVQRSASFALNVAFDVSPGRTIALLGPNGAGKSTAVAALAGLLPIDRGRISLGERVLDAPEADVFVPPEDRRVGVVFQHSLLFPHLTVLENVAFGLRSRKVAREQADDIAADWVGRLGLAGLERRRPRDLSGGQMQRVAIARTLADDPEVLLLDEPMAALDVATRVEMRHVLMEHLEAFAGPRLLITHDPTEAFLMADEVVVIEDGAVTQRGSAEDIRLRPLTSYVADLAGANLLAGLAQRAEVTVDGHVLHVADDHLTGPVLLTIRPTALSVHLQRPQGSPRNVWLTSVERLERLGSRVRLRTGAPLPVTIEVTDAAQRDLAFDKGSDVWIAVKATEIAVRPDMSRADD